ncbi:hypothetical protein [Pseudomonas alloputida]|uniref:head-tail joining protein n=1 Tax=Pseudomonas alloputida TaxID=1940621 RepID=UPI001E434BEA|nr:hypothetical protein [Pseudomonas alloputida]MCE1054971.1 hypothetical protein [Pseudomonas alloputida]
MDRTSMRERMAARTVRALVRVGDRATLEDGTEVLGLFDNPSLDPQLGSKRAAKGIDAAELDEPRFTVLSADAERLPRGAALTIELPPHEGGGPYTVVRPEATGDGMVALVLEVKHARTADIF